METSPHSPTIANLQRRACSTAGSGQLELPRLQLFRHLPVKLKLSPSLNTSLGGFKLWPDPAVLSVLITSFACTGTFSQKMYKRPPQSPVEKDNRQQPQSATEKSPILVWFWGHQWLTSELTQNKYTGIEMSPPEPFYNILMKILSISLNYHWKWTRMYANNKTHVPKC